MCAAEMCGAQRGECAMLNVSNVVLAAGLSLLSWLPNPGNAATIATFSFTQGGWVDGTYALAGSFTGKLDSNGYITKDTLTSFQATLVGVLPNTYGLGIFAFPSSLFSFDTFTPIDSGSLAIYSPAGGIYPLCVGAPAAFGLCGGELGPSVRGRLGPYSTQQAPVVTLVSMVTEEPPPPTSTPGVPEPATWALTILGFAALGQSLRRLRKPSTIDQ